MGVSFSYTPPPPTNQSNPPLDMTSLAPLAKAIYCCDQYNHPRDINADEYELIKAQVIPGNGKTIIVSKGSNCVLLDTSKSSEYNSAQSYNTRRLDPANRLERIDPGLDMGIRITADRNMNLPYTDDTYFEESPSPDVFGKGCDGTPTRQTTTKKFSTTYQLVWDSVNWYGAVITVSDSIVVKSAQVKVAEVNRAKAEHCVNGDWKDYY